MTSGLPCRRSTAWDGAAMSHRPAPPGPADDTALPLVGREREQALLAKYLAAVYLAATVILLN